MTGGCGFIGSHLVDALIKEGFYVTVLDDLSAGTDDKYVSPHVTDGNAKFVKGDIRDDSLLGELMPGTDIVFHLAAQPDVKISVSSPYMDFDINVVGSMKILEAMRKYDVNRLVFAASAGTVYGETEVLPTHEEVPLRPISNYGAAKAAVEQYLASYAHLYGLHVVSLRLGNVYGPRSTHGVMHDFFHKLQNDPTRLEILGDGNQRKEYLHIDDTVRAFMKSADLLNPSFQFFNVAKGMSSTVTEIADNIVAAMGLHDVAYDYTGGERGWPGDVRRAETDVSKLEGNGWKAEVSLAEGMKNYVDWMQSQNA